MGDELKFLAGRTTTTPPPSTLVQAFSSSPPLAVTVVRVLFYLEFVRVYESYKPKVPYMFVTYDFLIADCRASCNGRMNNENVKFKQRGMCTREKDPPTLATRQKCIPKRTGLGLEMLKQIGRKYKEN
ncbi:hypothetical protein QVD17_04262 [Tagetes erecta]|uniref:Uncharacterized protein n=1 Tax=Tagetes erecta TaxID=13708 RepID=A0AAD8P9L5_TARER|nr:hypothetical protein QVD17_04262 [Tagetes erecta]